MLTVTIPNQKDILSKSYELKAVEGQWLESCLNGMQKKRGVYVFHKDPEKILYVGKTSGRTMGFGMRLRRHFQKRAAGGNHRWYRLKEHGDVRASFIPEEMIRDCVSGTGDHPARLSDATICLMEWAIILSWKPSFQQEAWSDSN